MRFGVYVHTQGPSTLREVARLFSQLVAQALEDVALSEVDGLFLGFQSFSSFYTGIKPGRRKLRRNYDLRLITGGTEHYACSVELDSALPDGEVVEAATSEEAMFEFIRARVSQVLPAALHGFPASDLASVQFAVTAAELPHGPRW